MRHKPASPKDRFPSLKRRYKKVVTPIFYLPFDLIYLVLQRLILIGNLIGLRDIKEISKVHFWVWL